MNDQENNQDFIDSLASQLAEIRKEKDDLRQWMLIVPKGEADVITAKITALDVRDLRINKLLDLAKKEGIEPGANRLSSLIERVFIKPDEDSGNGETTGAVMDAAIRRSAGRTNE